MPNEWNGEYWELCRDCHDYPCCCPSDDLEDVLIEQPENEIDSEVKVQE